MVPHIRAVRNCALAHPTEEMILCGDAVLLLIVSFKNVGANVPIVAIDTHEVLVDHLKQQTPSGSQIARDVMSHGASRDVTSRVTRCHLGPIPHLYRLQTILPSTPPPLSRMPLPPEHLQ